MFEIKPRLPEYEVRRTRACAVSGKTEFTFVNEFFRNKRNAEIGHYGQTLSKVTIATFMV